MVLPYVPGLAVRFVQPDRRDLQQMIRDRVAERGFGLYVFALPFRVGGSQVYSLVEAYRPDDMRPATWKMVDPFRRADWQDGNLVAIGTKNLRGTFEVGGGTKGGVYAFFDLHQGMIDEINRNNRHARADLKRQSNASYRKRELEQRHEDSEAPIFKAFEEIYEDAYRESLGHAFGKPYITPGINLQGD